MGRGRNPTVTDNEIRDALNEPDQVVFLTEEVADQLDISPRQMRDRLSELADNEEIRHRMVGNNHIWWHPFAESALSWPHPEDRTNRPFDIDAVYSRSGLQFAATLDLPGSGETLLNRQIAVSFVFRTLLIETSVTVNELQRIGWIAEPGSTYEDSDSLWNNCLYNALDQVALFQYYPDDENYWEVTSLSEILKENLGERLLWNDWATRQNEIRDIVSKYYLKSIVKRAEREDIDFILENDQWAEQHLTEEISIYVSFEDEPVWLQTPVIVHLVLHGPITEEFATKIRKNPNFELRTDEETDQPAIKVSVSDEIELAPQYFDEHRLTKANTNPPIQHPSDGLDPLKEMDSILKDLS